MELLDAHANPNPNQRNSTSRQRRRARREAERHQKIKVAGTDATKNLKNVIEKEVNMSSNNRGCRNNPNSHEKQAYEPPLDHVADVENQIDAENPAIKNETEIGFFTM